LIRETRETRRKIRMQELIYKEESYQIIGAGFEVYTDKGAGFYEPVYHECLGIEFELRGIPAISKPRQELEYKGRKLQQVFEPDYVCHRKIVVELKAVAELLNEHRAQVLNYLKATGFQLGFLVNFGHSPKLQYERIANTKPREANVPASLKPLDLHT
jgi:GxxExxY protein